MSKASNKKVIGNEVVFKVLADIARELGYVDPFAGDLSVIDPFAPDRYISAKSASLSYVSNNK